MYDFEKTYENARSFCKGSRNLIFPDCFEDFFAGGDYPSLKNRVSAKNCEYFNTGGEITPGIYFVLRGALVL